MTRLWPIVFVFFKAVLVTAYAGRMHIVKPLHKLDHRSAFLRAGHDHLIKRGATVSKSDRNRAGNAAAGAATIAMAHLPPAGTVTVAPPPQVMPHSAPQSKTPVPKSPQQTEPSAQSSSASKSGTRKPMVRPLSFPTPGKIYVERAAPKPGAMDILPLSSHPDIDTSSSSKAVDKKRLAAKFPGDDFKQAWHSMPKMNRPVRAPMIGKVIFSPRNPSSASSSRVPSPKPKGGHTTEKSTALRHRVTSRWSPPETPRGRSPTRVNRHGERLTKELHKLSPSNSPVGRFPSPATTRLRTDMAAMRDRSPSPMRAPRMLPIHRASSSDGRQMSPIDPSSLESQPSRASRVGDRLIRAAGAQAYYGDSNPGAISNFVYNAMAAGVTVGGVALSASHPAIGTVVVAGGICGALATSCHGHVINVRNHANKKQLDADDLRQRGKQTTQPAARVLRGASQAVQTATHPIRDAVRPIGQALRPTASIERSLDQMVPVT